MKMDDYFISLLGEISPVKKNKGPGEHEDWWGKVRQMMKMDDFLFRFLAKFTSNKTKCHGEQICGWKMYKKMMNMDEKKREEIEMKDDKP